MLYKMSSGAILFAYMIFTENEMKIKKHPSAPINESGVIQMIGMGKFTGLIRVNTGSDTTVYKKRC